MAVLAAVQLILVQCAQRRRAPRATRTFLVRHIDKLRRHDHNRRPVNGVHSGGGDGGVDVCGLTTRG